MKKILMFLILHIPLLANNQDVINNYENWQNLKTYSKLKDYDRSISLQKADNELLKVSLDSLYQKQYYIDYIKDKELEREYYKHLIRMNRRRDYHKYRYHDEYKQYKYYY